MRQYSMAAVAALILPAAVAAAPAPSIRDAIIPITPEASKAASRDLPGIDRMFAGHRYIGLGEATHGTREIFELKARIVMALVLRGGVRAIAFESSYGSTLAASDYINLVGSGDVRSALTSLRIPTYQTQEIAGLLTALRAINARRPLTQRVQLFGYDMQDPRGDVRATLAFLSTNGLGDLAGDAVTRFAEGRGPVQTIPPAEVPALQSAITELRDGYRRARPSIVGHSSDHDYDRYLHALDVALQALSLFDAPSQMSAYYKRDALAATNVEWIAATVGGPVIIWAHNIHIAKDNEVPEFVTLGEALANAHGSDYFAVGSAFFDGSVRAISGGKLVANEVGPPRAASFEHFLMGQGGGGDYIVNLKQAASRSPAWRSKVSVPTTLRTIGSAYEPEVDDRTYRPTTPSAMYDAIAFVRHSTASIPYDVSTPQPPGGQAVKP